MSPMKHLVPALRLFHGTDSLAALPAELKRLGSRRSVIVCGASLIHEGAALDLIRGAMGELCAGVIGSVRAHSPLDAVEATTAQIQRLEADSVIAVGGGSAIVTARSASILLAERADPRKLCTSRNSEGILQSPKLLAPKLPQLVIPTTPTTATLKAGSAILDPLDGKRLALFDPQTRAKAVFIHPALLKTPPRDLIVSSGLNTLVMAIEGLTSRSGDPFSDALLMHSARLLAQRLPEVQLNDGDDVRSDLMFASLMCGHGTDYTGAGIAIPLGHAISARFHVDNGTANAIVLPHVIRFNADAAIVGLEKLASAFNRPSKGPATICAVIGVIASLLDELRTPRRLRDIGVTRETLPELAAISMEDWFVRQNVRPVRSANELEEILERAW